MVGPGIIIVSDDQLLQMAGRSLGRPAQAYQLCDVQVVAGSVSHRMAAVTVERNGKTCRGTAVHHDIVMAAGLAYVAACNSAVQSAADEDRQQAAI
ncbi:hypothetical protein RJP21_20810 [Paenibacillus sp. VCA1]|uniref:hypothetical protein n=1 Tax=Paenibacillus sp. VCA1 TaxID=3039148 RepID=UPI0028728BB8|nr:hypothetical protein [Paenibacillus sp. VCA1]MDR9856052.1 hypothetical protein [Paenibacillus sp. VCA1]